MSDIVIRVENLSKLYRIEVARHDTLRDQIAYGLRTLFSRDGRRSSVDGREDTIWALKDVSFEVKQGEVVGIIGSNGAGKSTLLKILSRITEPTSGYADIHGRVGSLLEVGTGFQGELTGRENIYLNGAILGMKKAEIERKFDEIVEFSGVEKFIDTPVKRYSSGMYVRLAFAVAAHLDLEILIVDEVLAVGDAAFQKKCLRKMEDVATQGRTVLLVSHNMATMMAQCQRLILLNSGHVSTIGPPREVVDYYMQTMEKGASVPLAARLDRGGDQSIKFVAFELRNSAGLSIPRVYSGQNLVIALRYQADTDKILKNVFVYVSVLGTSGEPLFQLSTGVCGCDFETLAPSGTILCHVPNLPLQPGKYCFNLYCKVNGKDADWIPKAGMIEVEAGDFFGSGKLPPAERGLFMVPHSWTIDSKPSL